MPNPTPTTESTTYRDIFLRLFAKASLASEVEIVTTERAGGTPLDNDASGDQLEVRAAFFRLAADDGGEMLVCAERTYYLSASEQNSTPSDGTATHPLQALDAGGGKLVFATAMAADHFTVKLADQFITKAVPAGLTLGKKISEKRFFVPVTASTPKEFYQTIIDTAELEAVDFAEPDFLFVTLDESPEVTAELPAAAPLSAVTPNDTCFSSQWNLPQISAPDGWSIATSATAEVPVFDIGVKTDHPDLLANLGASGWNFITNTGVLTDPQGHGTHVSGIIGAVGNNSIGVCGVCWSVPLMPLVVMKLVSGVPTGLYSAAETAAIYIRDLSVELGTRFPVANHSWGGTSYSQGLFNAFNNSYASPSPVPTPSAVTATWAAGSRILKLGGTASEIAKVEPAMTVSKTGSLPAGTVVLEKHFDGTYYYIILSAKPSITSGTAVPLTFSNPLGTDPYGTLHIASAGSSAANSDENPVFPASFPTYLVVSVGGSDKGVPAPEKPASDSNYGRYLVHLFAPSIDIWSTDLSPAYKTLTGASFGAPHVTGALALYYGLHPTRSELQGRTDLLGYGIDASSGFSGKCVSGGRLNINGLLSAP